MDQIPILKKQVLEQAKSKKLGEYVWTHGIGPQMGWTEKLAPKHFADSSSGFRFKISKLTEKPKIKNLIKAIPWQTFIFS